MIEMYDADMRISFTYVKQISMKRAILSFACSANIHFFEASIMK